MPVDLNNLSAAELCVLAAKAAGATLLGSEDARGAGSLVLRKNRDVVEAVWLDGVDLVGAYFEPLSDPYDAAHLLVELRGRCVVTDTTCTAVMTTPNGAEFCSPIVPHGQGTSRDAHRAWRVAITMAAARLQLGIEQAAREIAAMAGDD